MRMRVPFLALAAAVGANGAPEAPEWQPPAVTLSRLLAGGEGQAVRAALSGGDGVLAVDGVPGLGAARSAALRSLLDCRATAPTAFAGPHALKDGSSRRTLAAAGGDALPGELADSCPGFHQAGKSLRALFDQYAQAAAEAAGHEFAAQSGELVSLPSAHGPMSSVAAVLGKAPTLDHFHVYSPNASAPRKGAALPLHTDAGIMLAMVPALSDRGTRDTDFLLQRRDGSVVRPAFGTDQLVLLAGAAAVNWGMNTRMMHPLRPAPHAVWLSAGAERAWFGRMWELPPDARDPSADRSYGSWRADAGSAISRGRPIRASAALRRGATLGELGHDHAVELAAGMCDGQPGTIMCWIACRPVPSQSQPDVNGRYCNASVAFCSMDGHTPMSMNESMKMHKNAKTTCPASSPKVVSIPDHFCDRSLASDMYMGGFQVASKRDSNGCVILLFQSWVLDNRGKFAAGCIGVFLLGFLTDAWMAARKEAAKRLPPGWVGDIALVLFFGVQLTLGYFVMLVVMAYSVELFLCTIFGFMVSHFIFNRRTAPADGSGPTSCCGADYQAPVATAHAASVPITATPEQSLSAPLLERSSKVVRLRVDGMTCVSCAKSIQRAVRPRDAQVDHVQGTADVRLSEEDDPEDIRARIEAIGGGGKFRARVMKDPNCGGTTASCVCNDEGDKGLQ